MFSIVIPTYNRPDALKRTIGSILSLDIKEVIEIIVVNDSPGSEIPEFYDERVIILKNTKNLGRAKSRNAGAAAANFPILFFIDDDIEVNENIFDAYINEYKKGYDAVFSNVTNVRSDGQYSFLNEFLNTRGANKKKFRSKFRSNYFTTAFCSIKKDFFDRIGKFDEEFCSYGWEDPELGLRIESNQGKISFLKTEGLKHYHDKNVDEWIEQIEKSGNNLKYLINKHPQFKKKIHYSLLNSFIGAVIFNPLFVWSEKLKAKRSRGFLGYLNYSYLFKAAIYRSLR